MGSRLSSTRKSVKGGCPCAGKIFGGQRGKDPLRRNGNSVGGNSVGGNSVGGKTHRRSRRFRRTA